MTKRDELTQGRMTETLHKLGLSEWRAVWKPGCSSSKRGEALPESKMILVYDVDEGRAMETLIHECLEIKLRGITSPYRTLVNALLTWADEQAYREKEKAIDSLIPFFSTLGEVGPTSDSTPKGGFLDEPPQRSSLGYSSDSKKLRGTHGGGY